MNIPGFTAAASLKRTMSDYYFTLMTTGETGVVASFFGEETKNCGPCMELKFPNGTGTGACVKFCFDGQGKSEMVDCTCPPKRKGPNSLF